MRHHLDVNERLFDCQAPEGRLRADVGAYLAGTIPVGAVVEDEHGPIEPCHLCLAAATMARVGAVRYAGADPYAGAVGRGCVLMSSAARIERT